jgi:hypothetical protein
VYDKWRKIETTDGNEGSPNPEENYTWDSHLKNYIYTNRVVEGAQDGMIAPQEFPAKIEEVYNYGSTYGFTVDYDACLAFDTSEIVISAISTTSVLGRAILGQMVLA